MYPCLGSMKATLIGLENSLRAHDRAAARGEPMPAIVALAAVMQGAAQRREG